MKYNKKYTKEVLEPIVSESFSICEVLRKLDIKISGGIHTYVKKRIKDFNIDISHFTGQASNKGKISNNRKSPDSILILGNERIRRVQLHRALQETGVEYRCSKCGIFPEWNGEKLVLEIDHENGDCFDNRRKNLRYLCPNCHSQTKNYGGNGSHKKI